MQPRAFSAILFPLISSSNNPFDLGKSGNCATICAGIRGLPDSCADDARWAFAGLKAGDPETSKILNLILTPSSDESMPIRTGLMTRKTDDFERVVAPINGNWRLYLCANCA